jgi:hypothetical protein
MDRIELAERHYERIAPYATQLQPGSWTAEFEVWLRDYVVPATADFISRPALRERAAWPLPCLAPGSLSPQRRALKRVDRDLVASAKALCKLAEHEAVSREPLELWPSSQTTGTTGLALPPVRTPEETRTSQVTADPAFQVGQVNAIAGRYENRLGGCGRRVPSPLQCDARRPEVPHSGDRVALQSTLHPEFRPSSDFLTRCILSRILRGKRRLRCAAGLIPRALIRTQDRVPNWSRGNADPPWGRDRWSPVSRRRALRACRTDQPPPSSEPAAEPAFPEDDTHPHSTGPVRDERS